ncbi:hypothetical protein VMCG_04738 [Cytospora schulzeri]|uniref:glutathione transferase n=1 Tax=Cytospora schulzeri TaxID=448051 RepID=A0A423WMV2_9PEZI|nr:hypothetical protein VMCG_04738 [Valsa malicola]
MTKPILVVLVLEELQVPYNIKSFKFEEIKQKPFIDINPNGRVPVHFQVSGQGPYFGQAGWFTVLHAEKLPSAIERYQNEVRRIHGVLEGWLQMRNWLVGDKITYADLAFATWNDRSDAVLSCAPEDKFKGFPRVQAWHERMTSRPSWKKAMDTRARLMDEQGLDWNGMPKGIKSMAEYEAKINADREGATGDI